MNKVLTRIMAIAKKEWRLNLRFSMEYFASNAVSPVKTTVLMYCLYHGFLSGKEQSLGVVNSSNYLLFVLVGSTCHSLFMASMSTFRHKMVAEKYWQTTTATFVSPASIFEVVAGYVLGSVGIHLFLSSAILIGIAFLFSIPLNVALSSLMMILLICFLGFGLGIISTTISLVWEGKSFLFDYLTQVIVFLSCFYYPVEVIPQFLRPMVKMLPTYRATNMIQTLFLSGHQPNFTLFWSYVVAWSLFVLVLPSLMLEYSVKKWGISGY